MSAATHKGLSNALTVGAVLLVAYIGYKLVFGSKVSAAQRNPYALSGGGAGGYYPNPYAYGTQNTGQSTLGSLLSSLLGGGKSSGGGASKGGLGSSNPSSMGGGSSSGVNPLQTLADFVNMGNSQLQADPAQNLPELGGDYSIPEVPTNDQFNWGGFDYNPFSSVGTDLTGNDYAMSDPFAGGGGFDPSISEEPMQNVDVGSFDYSGD